MTVQPWQQAPLVALDLEGTGAQDREQEAILEVAVVPLHDGHPDLPCAFATLVNPGRGVPRRPWISPGINDQTLSTAPPFDRIATDLAERIDSRWIVGHNVGVDWRLLRRYLPDVRPAGLLDTLALARAVGLDSGRALTALVDQAGLDGALHVALPTGQPHRALWDATAAAFLLTWLVGRYWPKRDPTLNDLRAIAGIDLAPPAEQPSLF
ncbi:3'-5' exonuclease [Frankia sp. CNm7]|uniref:3'-5' exonuclease n=1 Tax=Frankia nepalensis TaxID=1836974 RepID=A0A937RCK9_9ACTN|nr:3'-5' exonuclease [Frankia nepalensis]MBL7502294.1 3'-5' exonuclease [Frankia nepalensis]MBL7514035.1 3'-5' exonuclease [Frankia nepalensis]MBL7520204.1 3'-5' exonuclease [Frankia nepalensis]MBL7626419.1 3'-5' exonuclease [Frankia nepalensis]